MKLSYEAVIAANTIGVKAMDKQFIQAPTVFSSPLDIWRLPLGWVILIGLWKVGAQRGVACQGIVSLDDFLRQVLQTLTL